MPYSIKTRDGITINNIPDEIAKDSQELKDRVAKLRESRGAAVSVQPEVASSPEAEKAPSGFPDSPSTLDKVKSGVKAVGEMVTGNERATPETQSMEDWMQMPDLGLEGGMAAFKTVLGSTFAGPDEIAQIIKKNLPGVGVRQDEKGNYIFKSAIDGEERAMAPGITASDIGRFFTGAPLMAIPFGGTVARAAAIGGATQAGIEASQAATGGEFNPEDVLLAGATGGALKGGASALSAVNQGIKQALTKTPDQALMTDLAANVSADAPVPPITIGGPPAQLSPLELATEARKAAVGGVGANKATQTVAEQAAPDESLAAAAKELGVEVSPEFLAKNKNYRDLIEATSSYAGSPAAGNQVKSIAAVANKAEEVLRDIGASGDKGALRAGIKEDLTAAIKNVAAQEKRLSDELRVKINPKKEIRATKVLSFLQEEIDKAGGNMQVLSSLEKEIYRDLKPKKVPVDKTTSSIILPTGRITDEAITEFTEELPTIHLFDNIRAKVGSARKYNNAYPDANEGRMKHLYNLLKEDYTEALKGAPEAKLLAERNALTQYRKGLEDQSKDLFGKKLSANLINQLDQVTKGLTKGGDEAFLKTMNAIPEEFRQDAAAESVRMMFGKLKADGTLDIGSFSRFWDGLKANPRSYTALATNLPKGAVQKLENINKLSKAVTAKPGESVDIIKQRIIGTETLMEKVSDAVRRFGSRAGAEVATSAAGLHGAGIMWALANAFQPKNKMLLKGADEIFSSPEFLMTVKKLGTTDEKIALKKFTMSKAFKSFTKALGNPKDLEKFDEVVLQAIQAASRPNREQIL